MKELASEVVQNIQQAASSKTALVAGLTGASVGAWIERIVTDPIFQNSMILIGAMVPITIVALNISKLVNDYRTRDERMVVAQEEALQAIEKTHQDRMRSAILRDQIKEKGLSVD